MKLIKMLFVAVLVLSSAGAFAQSDRDALRLEIARLRVSLDQGVSLRDLQTVARDISARSLLAQDDLPAEAREKLKNLDLMLKATVRLWQITISGNCFRYGRADDPGIAAIWERPCREELAVELRALAAQGANVDPNAQIADIVGLPRRLMGVLAENARIAGDALR